MTNDPNCKNGDATCGGENAGGRAGRGNAKVSNEITINQYPTGKIQRTLDLISHVKVGPPTLPMNVVPFFLTFPSYLPDLLEDLDPILRI